MERTLLTLRKSIDKLINQHGEDAPVAAWIFTSEDVKDYPEESVVTKEIAEKVVNNLDNYDYIYTEIFDCIDQELRSMEVM